MPFGLLPIFTTANVFTYTWTSGRLATKRKKEDESKTLLRVLKIYFCVLLNVMASNQSIDFRPFTTRSSHLNRWKTVIKFVEPDITSSLKLSSD